MDAGEAIASSIMLRPIPTVPVLKGFHEWYESPGISLTEPRGEIDVAI